MNQANRNSVRPYRKILISFISAGISLSCLGCVARPPVSQTFSSIPVPFPVTTSIRQDIFHEVAPMETLWRISKMYGVDQKAIIETNQLKDPRSISVGQRLLIPQAAQIQPVVPLYHTRPWSYIVVHHSATHEGNALTIDAMHYRRGFGNGLGYHFLIDNGTLGKQVGQIEAGPRWIKQMDGAHCNAAGMNERGIGICMIGNFSESDVQELQLNALVALVNALRAHYKIPLDHVIGHRDVPGKNTECPGTYFPWEDFKRKLAEFERGAA